MFIHVMGLTTRKVTSCTALLAVGRELTRSADVSFLWNEKFNLKLKVFVGVNLLAVLRQSLLDLLELIDTSQFDFSFHLKSFDESFKSLPFLEDFSGQSQRFGFYSTQIVEEFIKTFDCQIEVGPVEFVRLEVAFVGCEENGTVEFVMKRKAGGWIHGRRDAGLFDCS
jgi:hypothetical protein